MVEVSDFSEMDRTVERAAQFLVTMAMREGERRARRQAEAARREAWDAKAEARDFHLEAKRAVEGSMRRQGLETAGQAAVNQLPVADFSDTQEEPTLELPVEERRGQDTDLRDAEELQMKAEQINQTMEELADSVSQGDLDAQDQAVDKIVEQISDKETLAIVDQTFGDVDFDAVLQEWSQDPDSEKSRFEERKVGTLDMTQLEQMMASDSAQDAVPTSEQRSDGFNPPTLEIPVVSQKSPEPRDLGMLEKDLQEIVEMSEKILGTSVEDAVESGKKNAAKGRTPGQEHSKGASRDVGRDGQGR